MSLELLPDSNHPLVMPWEPWAKKRPRISRGGGRTHQPKDDRNAEERTRSFLEQWWAHGVYVDEVILGARFYRSTRITVDLDNLMKHLLDAATGIIWVNDCQVSGYDQPRVHLDRENPRTELWVLPHVDATMGRLYDPETGKVLR